MQTQLDRAGRGLAVCCRGEQQQKDIRKAAYETVCCLADALHCTPEDVVNIYYKNDAIWPIIYRKILLKIHRNATIIKKHDQGG